MFKKIFALATLLCVIPMMAGAASTPKWQLGTRAMSLGGKIDSRNMTGQKVINGSVFRQYTTNNSSTVTVTPDSGFKISKITNNGIVTVAPIAAPYTSTPAGTGNVSIQATFARVSFVLNAIAGSGGTVNKSSYPLVYTGNQSPAKTFIFTPNPGLRVTAITASAGALNTNFQYLNAVTGQPTGLGVINERVKVSVVNVPSNITFSASFSGTPPAPPVIDPAVGPAATARNQCANCHATQGVGASVFATWSSNSHKSDGRLMCYECHAGANTGAHPGAPQSCTACHATATATIATNYNSSRHKTNSVSCDNCHAAAGPHAVTMAKNSDCLASCHTTSSERTKFEASRHWDNHLEYGPEFAGGAVPGQLDANNSYTTTENGTLVTCAYRCHFKPGMGPDPTKRSTGGITYSDSTGTFNRPTGDGCLACHDAHKLGATFKDTCLTCHSGSKHGKVPNEFFASKHWVNHLETGPEFAGGAVPGQLDANNSYTTTENGTLVTCAYRCHFKPGMGPDPTKRSTGGIEYVDPQTAVKYQRPTGDACLACHDAHGLDASYKDTCLTCHSGSKHGKVPNEFFNSKHWKSSLETGTEFANQINTTVVGGSVVANGTIDGVLNANDSYTTTENGSTVTCAYRCHFRPGMYPAGVTPPATYVANKKAITYVMYSSPYGAGRFTRPGGNACMACHNPHGLEATARSTCYTCHAGGNHGWSVKAFEKSTHFTGTYAIAEGIGGPTGKACTECHNAHSLEAAFFTMSGASGLVKKGTDCQKCHTPGASYAVYDATGAGKAPHFLTTANSWDTANTAAYTGTGANCADCHSHNNTINAGWADGGHGDVTAIPWKGDSGHKDWGAQGTNGVNYQVSPESTNCIRCHSAVGFIAFVDSGFTKIDKLAASEKAGVLTCNACHSNVDKGTVRLVNFTSQHNGVGYTARYGYKNALANNVPINTAMYLGNNKNSNICMPCHSQRASGQEIKDVFALGNFKQYSAGSAIYPHAAQPAAITVGKGAYEFTPFTAPADGHFKIGNTGTGTGYMTTGITQGSCVACHMNSDKTHSLEITATTFTKSCNKCHPADFTQASVDAAKASFSAAVDALGKQLVNNGITKDGVNPLPERTAFDMSLGAKDNTVAQKNMGAWFNWYLFKVSDPGAFAHNPSYSKKMILDSIDVLQHGTVTGSVDPVVGAPAGALQGIAGVHPNNPSAANSCATCHKATQLTAGSDCIGCHSVGQKAAGGLVNDNDGVRTITTEFAKWSHHVTGVALQNAHCAACHLEGKVQAGVIVADSTYHMADAMIHLRNADDDSDMQWDPEAPNHTTMDGFCMSCHDVNGATSTQSAAIRALMIPAAGKTASATNPFADTISNRYDKMQRPSVIDVKGQFGTDNPSHHAVTGQKYTSRTRSGSSFQGNFTVYSSPTSVGSRKTIYEAGKFSTTYVPLPTTGAATNGQIVADDSVLHCGDCHTVGQWAARGTTAYANANTYANYSSYNRVAIGAHGSENEYMLRNSAGTDALHKGYTTTNVIGVNLVCFNCHNFKQYSNNTGHASDQAGTNLNCNASGNSFAGYTTGITNNSRLRRNTADWTTVGNGGGSTIFAIQCANCHNSGPNNKFGGIHGSKVQTYTDGTGQEQKARRFLPGLGNTMYVPGRTVVGDDDRNWEKKSLATSNREGCYTLNNSATAPAKNQQIDGANILGSWGSCSDHGGSATAGGHNVTRGMQRPVTY